MTFQLNITSTCNICGCSDFVAGFNGRLMSGRPPQCKGCSSMERHRALRDIYLSLPKDWLGSSSCVQFSADTSVDRAWFASFTVSEYGGVNSQDLMAITYTDAEFDWIICNHVLEHVADDSRAVSELVRICDPSGVVQLSFPMPHWLPRTRDWGHPDPRDHGHYRYYGADVVNTVLRTSGAAGCLVVIGADPATGARENAYLLFKEPSAMERMTEHLIRTHPVIPITY